MHITRPSEMPRKENKNIHMGLRAQNMWKLELRFPNYRRDWKGVLMLERGP